MSGGQVAQTALITAQIRKTTITEVDACVSPHIAGVFFNPKWLFAHKIVAE